MTAPVIADALGPRARRRATVISVVAGVVFAALVVWALLQLKEKGQLDAAKWRPFTEAAVVRFLWVGLLNTVKAAVIGMTVSMVLGSVLALARFSRLRAIRWVAAIWVEFFRGIPLVTLILFSALGLPVYGIKLDPLWYLVIGLVLYNSAILAEIFRAGILSLDRGQTEAALAIGLTYWQGMRMVLVPQGFRRMIPAIVSQLITLLKDTSLGFVASYQELLSHGNQLGQFSKNLLQSLFVVALMYLAVNLVLSRIARRLEVRQRRRFGGGGIGVRGLDELALVEATAEAEASA